MKKESRTDEAYRDENGILSQDAGMLSNADIHFFWKKGIEVLVQPE